MSRATFHQKPCHNTGFYCYMHELFQHHRETVKMQFRNAKKSKIK